ncbi:hypothetical protein [Actinacidiphila sp. ITFR-21]|uniref:hypothetical protein n=1 Tax=Actinacidiphila sp. ITFR-21 TaxID=3075199 RepID=UPI00288C5FDC|nr:hypothetical protein [Streptomyces sp. ITFR-21]WNI19132.1 hypothetical protein RLT57_28750 [Streptomyces sp. ITFR-21]
MAIACLIALAVVAALAAAALFSGHIPLVREWTGAAPLQTEDATTDRNFAKSRAAGYVESADDWAARVEARSGAAQTKEAGK